MYTCQPEDVVERLVSFHRENNRGSKMADVGREMDKEVELWLCDKNAGGTDCCHVKKVFDCSAKLSLRKTIS
jgi:hypothetical protein